MMRREGISWLSTTTKSIEETATTVLQEVGLGPLLNRGAQRCQDGMRTGEDRGTNQLSAGR